MKTTKLEMRGIEPRAFRMQSEHSTTELHPLTIPHIIVQFINQVYGHKSEISNDVSEKVLYNYHFNIQLIGI